MVKEKKKVELYGIDLSEVPEDKRKMVYEQIGRFIRGGKIKLEDDQGKIQEVAVSEMIKETFDIGKPTRAIIKGKGAGVSAKQFTDDALKMAEHLVGEYVKQGFVPDSPFRKSLEKLGYEITSSRDKIKISVPGYTFEKPKLPLANYMDAALRRKMDLPAIGGMNDDFVKKVIEYAATELGTSLAATDLPSTIKVTRQAAGILENVIREGKLKEFEDQTGYSLEATEVGGKVTQYRVKKVKK